MAALNASDFESGGGAYVEARGAKQKGSGWVVENGGMAMPVQVHLRIGQRYFRFSNSSQPKEQQKKGGWWVEFETFNAIRKYAREQATPREAARYLLGLPWGWTPCDVLLTAILEEPLDAYRGEGKPASSSHPNDRGTRWIPPQHLEVYQLFIPGLAREISPNTYLVDVAFPKVETSDIWHSPYFQ
jgi:hypothetical protein